MVPIPSGKRISTAVFPMSCQVLGSGSLSKPPALGDGEVQQVGVRRVAGWAFGQGHHLGLKAFKSRLFHLIHSFRENQGEDIPTFKVAKFLPSPVFFITTCASHGNQQIWLLQTYKKTPKPIQIGGCWWVPYLGKSDMKSAPKGVELWKIVLLTLKIFQKCQIRHVLHRCVPYKTSSERCVCQVARIQKELTNWNSRPKRGGLSRGFVRFCLENHRQRQLGT